MRQQPQRGAVAGVHHPATRAGGTLGGRRVAGAAQLEGAGGEVEGEVDRGREPLLPVLAEQEVVGGRQELVGRERAQQAAQGAGHQQGAGAGALALAGDVDDGDLEPVSPARARR